MGDYAAKGREYVDKADRKLKGFSLFTSSSSKNEDAVELLERAATQFKLAQSCEAVPWPAHDVSAAQREGRHHACCCNAGKHER